MAMMPQLFTLNGLIIRHYRKAKRALIRRRAIFRLFFTSP